MREIAEAGVWPAVCWGERTGMPSLAHEILVELFRGGGLAAELLRTCAGVAIEHARAELGSIDLSEVAPAEYRADAVVILRDRAERAVAGIIVEVQRQIDRDKANVWPQYVTGLRTRLGCAVILMVVAPDPEVAAWARQRIALGHPGFELLRWEQPRREALVVEDFGGRGGRCPPLPRASARAHPRLAGGELPNRVA